jgi:DNA-3-methyladenine glycosylase
VAHPAEEAVVKEMKKNSAPLRLRGEKALAPLPRDFYERSPTIVARELLGKMLLRKMPSGEIIAGRVVETEAYLGEADLAAHSAVGKTPRNEVMFGHAGHAYVYLSYGIHYCMNVSCELFGKAGAVLFRALEPVSGIDQMEKWRGIALKPEPATRDLKLLTSGPGRLAQALHITRPNDNGKDLTSADSNLLIVDGEKIPKSKITASPRIGITKSADLPLRFYVAGNPFVSAKRL